MFVLVITLKSKARVAWLRYMKFVVVEREYLQRS